MPYVPAFDRTQMMMCSWDSFVYPESVARLIDAFVNSLDLTKYKVKEAAGLLMTQKECTSYIFMGIGKESVLHGNWLKAVKLILK